MEENVKWEYNYIHDVHDMPTSRLRNLGQDGWELVSVDNGIAYFKRRMKIINKEQGGYTYETSQDGYVVYDINGLRIPPYELIKLLTKDELKPSKLYRLSTDE